MPTFTHFLDLPILFLIIALGAMQPTTWTLFFTGLIASVGTRDRVDARVFLAFILGARRR